MSIRLDELRAAAEAEFAARQNGQQPPADTHPLTQDELSEVGPATQEAQQAQVTAEPEPASEPAAVAPEPEAPTVAVEPSPAPEPRKKNVYSRVIDLGDGSTPQVFRGATKDELIEKIAVAQANASRRIRELKNQLKTKAVPEPAPPTPKLEPQKLTAEDEFLLGQEIQTAPTEALSKALKALLGTSVDELKESLEYTRANKQREHIAEIGRQFVSANPDYPAGDQKAERLMAEYIQKNRLAWTVKNLEIAFDELREAGLVSGLPATAPVVTVADEDADSVLEVPSITPAAPVVVPKAQLPQTPAALPTNVVEEPRRKRSVVGVSSAQTVATVESAVPPRELSVDDLLKLSPAERRRIVLQAVGKY